MPRCLALYAANEVGRFPERASESYEKSLREQTSYFVVAESEGQIIASGGLSYWLREDIVVMCFGWYGPAIKERASARHFSWLGWPC